MAMENKFGITNAAELARVEERISKGKAIELFENNLIDDFEIGKFSGLAKIHRFLFEDIYEFAGDIRKMNVVKGNFQFVPVMHLGATLKNIDYMRQSTYEEIIKKYVEMNIAHPFREGNGRSTRIWLDCILKKELKVVIHWQKVDKEEYLLAMERSPKNEEEIKNLLKKALTDQIADKGIYMQGIDASYGYEGFHAFKTQDL